MKPIKAATARADVFGTAEPLTTNALMVRTKTPCRVTYDDAGPDSYGRRRFTLEWDQDHGDYYLRRGQCFFAVPSEHIAIEP